MIKKLHYIRKKIDAVQFGLVRYHNNHEKITVHVRAKTGGDNMLVCVSTDSANLEKLANKRVSIIQKSENDYLYISGKVKGKPEKNQKVFFIAILKASWFVRKSRGSISWLQEKYIYDPSVSDNLQLAS